MALIRINNENENIYGRMEVSRERVFNPELNANEIIISGVLATHNYIEEIDTIETERYLLEGVDVYKEIYGSNDINICYEFFADSITIKDEHVPDDILWTMEEEEIQKEIDNKEYFHSYAFNEGLMDAQKRAEKLKKEMEDNNE